MKKHIIITTLMITHITYSMDKKQQNTSALNTIIPSLQKPASAKQEQAFNKMVGLYLLDNIIKHSGIREVPEIKLQSRLFVPYSKL